MKELKAKFLAAKDKWNEETMYSSSVTDIVGNDSFQEIVAMGNAAIPFIIDEIEKKPSVLVWALNMITGASFTDTTVTITVACKKWVKAYREFPNFYVIPK